jgi:hypothetical protein
MAANRLAPIRGSWFRRGGTGLDPAGHIFLDKIYP